jgi:hypothetical protein
MIAQGYSMNALQSVQSPRIIIFPCLNQRHAILLTSRQPLQPPHISFTKQKQQRTGSFVGSLVGKRLGFGVGRGVGPLEGLFVGSLLLYSCLVIGYGW